MAREGCGKAQTRKPTAERVASGGAEDRIGREPFFDGSDHVREAPINAALEFWRVDVVVQEHRRGAEGQDGVRVPWPQPDGLSEPATTALAWLLDSRRPVGAGAAHGGVPVHRRLAQS